MKRFLDRHSLPAQLILSFFVVIIVTATVVGLPAMLFFRQQLDRQAWSQVERGKLAAQAAYSASQGELLNLATLAAGRPTLHQLMAGGNRQALEEYLRTLSLGAGLDHMIVCNLQGEVLVHTGEELPADVCTNHDFKMFLTVPQGNHSRILLAGSRPILSGAKKLGDLIVAFDLDQQFMSRLRAETGVEQGLLLDGHYLASSLFTPPGAPGGDSPAMVDNSAPAAPEDSNHRFKVAGRPYYAARQSLGESGLLMEVALDVSNVAAAQRRLFWILTGGIVTIAALGILFGGLISSYLSRPLVELASAASRLSRGDLISPVEVKTRVREETMVADALESARANLQHNLTDLKREKEWSDHLLDSIVEGIMTLDHRNQITFFSRGAERITGWDRAAVLGKNCDQVFRLADSQAPFSEFIPAPGQANRVSIEVADGHWASLSMTGARLAPAEAGEAEIALVFRDVSSEEVIHHLLGQFIANVTHEFRTPLAALAASVELLLDQGGNYSPEEMAELLSSLHLGILSLQTLVDNLLESASIEAGHFRVSPRPFSLEQIVGEASLTMQPLLEKYEQRLVLHLPEKIPLVRVDPRRTIQVLVNLLANASKFGPAGEEITLSASTENGWVRLAISDRGPGITEEGRENLYRRFIFPKTASESLKTGAGLGLSVVKAVVEAQGGQTGVEDRPGGGSTFWFTVPAAGEEKTG